MSITFFFLHQNIDSTLKIIFHKFHGSNAKELFYDFCQEIVVCEIYRSFA